MSTSSTKTPTAGQSIPIPADFPVSWDKPGDEKRTWQLDNHATEPLPPLSYSVISAVLGGFNNAFPQLKMPIRIRNTIINGFPYATVMQTDAPPEAVVKTIGAMNRFAPALIRLLMGRMSAGMAKQQLDKLNPILARLDTYWLDELLPEINQHFAYLESCDPRGLSMAQLRAHLTESLKRAEKLGELHALGQFPAMTAMSLFEELYSELFQGSNKFDALRLLQGFDNQTLEGDRVLWSLSRAALTIPTVYQALAENSAYDVIQALEKSAEGRRFLANLRAYLVQHGQRLNIMGAINTSSWIEDPSPVIEILKAYITRSDTRTETEQDWLIAEREKAVAQARTQLAGYPEPVVSRFETLLKAAQTAVHIKEDNHWTIERLFYQMRRLGLEFGRRLGEAGALETPDDVFYLTSDELLDERGGGTLQERVGERKAVIERFRRVTPLPMLGVLPPFEVDGGPLFRAGVKGEMGSSEGIGDSHSLKGEAGSPGIVRGTAKVVRSLAEAGKLQRGDVLVVERTLPPWTPLFATAAAVVTNTGGVLCHCAIVAREYGIPAVVGTGRATKVFHDGQILEVDGDAGVVRVVNEA